MGEHARLQIGHAGDVVGALQAQDVGMAADRAGGRAGGVEHHHVEGAARRPGRRVGLDDLGGEREPLQVVAQALEPRGRMSTAVTRAPAAARAAVLPPGAAQRSATPRPATSPATRATRAAPASCTHQAPSA